MLIWLITLAVYTVLSYLSDLAILPFLNKLKVPFFNASMLSVLLLVCTIAMLGRVLGKMRKKEKEMLMTKVLNLEKELKALKEKTENLEPSKT